MGGGVGLVVSFGVVTGVVVTTAVDHVDHWVETSLSFLFANAAPGTASALTVEAMAARPTRIVDGYMLNERTGQNPVTNDCSRGSWLLRRMTMNETLLGHYILYPRVKSKELDSV